MQKGSVFRNAVSVGEITKTQKEGVDVYLFVYSEEYLSRDDAMPISVSLPMQVDTFESTTLFPFFSNMLSEGNAKTIQCLKLKIDEDDTFTRLLKTVQDDPIGSITVKEVSHEVP